MNIWPWHDYNWWPVMLWTINNYNWGAAMFWTLDYYHWWWWWEEARGLFTGQVASVVASAVLRAHDHITVSFNLQVS
jgi:hypothetical protein